MQKVRKLIVLIIVSLLAVSTVTPAYAGTVPPWTRIYGADRAGTSNALFQINFYSNYISTPYPMNVLLADGYTNLQDALIATPYATYKGLPLQLYTPGTYSEAFFNGLHYESPTIFHSTWGLPFQFSGITPYSATWMTSDTKLPYILYQNGVSVECTDNFAAGLNSIDLSVKIANQLPTPQYVFIVNQKAFSDALSISPYSAYTKSPILLVDQNSVSPNVLNYINSHKSTIKMVYVIGGTGVISDSVMSQLPNAVRLAGSDRYGTCLQVNSTLPAVMYPIKQDGTTEQMQFYLMNGQDGHMADGISTAANASKMGNLNSGQNIFWLTNGSQFPYTSQQIIQALAPMNNFYVDLTFNQGTFNTNNLTVVGGPTVVPDSVAKTFWTIEGNILQAATNKIWSPSTYPYSLTP